MRRSWRSVPSGDVMRRSWGRGRFVDATCRAWGRVPRDCGENRNVRGAASRGTDAIKRRFSRGVPWDAEPSARRLPAGVPWDAIRLASRGRSPVASRGCPPVGFLADAPGRLLADARGRFGDVSERSWERVPRDCGENRNVRSAASRGTNASGDGFRVVPWDVEPSVPRLPAAVPWDAIRSGFADAPQSPLVAHLRFAWARSAAARPAW